MERIQEALEKARRERAMDHESEKNGLAQEASEASSGLGLASINYTKTRQIKLSDDELKERRVIGGLVHDERSEVYRQLRSQILVKLRENNWQTLAITSPNENAGKSLTAVNLAIALSQEVNQTVLLVDLDLQEPDVCNTLGLEVKVGLVDYLQGNAEMQEIMINPGFERLVILPSTPLASRSSELLSSPAMKSFLQEITGRYQSRIILFDLPPLLRNDDALVFTPYVDATLLIAEDGVSTPDEIKRCMQLLKDNRGNLIGTVLNKAR